MCQVLHNTSYLNIKEINLLLRDYVMKYGYDEIDYINFRTDLYDVRFDLARSRIMDVNIKKFPDDFFTRANSDKIDESGCMHVDDVRKIISDSKELTLTPCEINLILGLANASEDLKIDVASFTTLFKNVVSQMFSIEARRRKAQLV